jgi:type VII secretion integral membrane protein EccD
VKPEFEVSPQGADVCRVSIHLDGAQADIALPAWIPVGQLIPSLYDVLRRHSGPVAESVPSSMPTCLYRPGQPALDLSMTLSQQGIRDGALLVLAPPATAQPCAPVVHAADAVELTATGQTQGWSSERPRLAALLAATATAGVIGLLAVPDGLGTPSLLLCAASAAATAAISARVSRYGRTTLLTLTCVGTLIAVATLGATLFDLPGRRAALALAVIAVGVLSMSGRLAVVMSGLSMHIAGDLDPHSERVDADVWNRALRAQQVLTALVVGASTAAALGAAAVALGVGPPSPGWADFGVAGVIAAVLVLRSRAHQGPVRRASLLGSGTACTAALFVALAMHDPALTPWICATAAVLGVCAVWFGFTPPRPAGPPPVRRWFDIVDCAALVCVIPLAGWSSGIYGFVRGISL